MRERGTYHVTPDGDRETAGSRWYFLVLATSLSLSVLVVAAWIAVGRIVSDSRAEMEDALTTVLEISHQGIRSWVRGEQEEALTWASSPEVVGLTQDLLAVERSQESLLGAPAQNELRSLLGRVQVAKGYEGFFIVGPGDVSLSSSRDENVGLVNLLTSQERVLARLWAGELVLSLPQASDVPLPTAAGVLRPGRPTMFVGAPIRGPNGDVIALLTFRLDPGRDFTAIFQRGRIGTTGETYAFDERGRLISESRFDDQLRRIGLIPEGERGILNVQITDPGANLVEGEGTFEPDATLSLTVMAASATAGERARNVEGYRDYRGVPVVGAWLWDPELALGITTEIDQSEAFRTMRSGRAIIIVLTLLSGLLMLGVSVIYGVKETRTAKQEAVLRSILKQAPYGIYRSTEDGKFLMVNPALVEMLGYDSEAELLALDSIEELYVDPIQQAQVVAEAGATSGFEGIEVEWKRKEGGKITLRLAGHRVEDARGTGALVAEVFVEDVTERLSLEEQLRQAQRLEALGQLAGGVAHDFNNILSVIIVEAQLGMRRLGENDPVRERLSEIKAAGERATDLTRQLLAFSRKQVVEPVVLSLNALVTDISSMLSRLIGEDIHVTIATEEKLGNVLADRGQMEQILTNLVVNARDAMPNGGDLTIRTAMMTPDQAFLRTRPGLTSKPYAVLEVQDTGIGIPDDVKARMFDPFFTTKARGKGTGLGLATVYGIIQKMEGHIEVESELEVGTTMGIYLPIVDEEETGGQLTEDSLLVMGDETVLVVEDDVRLRRIAVQLLEEQGYTVLSAGDGAQALQQLGAYEGDVHLLLTDVVMPGMGGREVAERFLEMRPGAKVLYMSGYTDDEILHEKLSTRDVTILFKPFTAESLTAAVRKILDEE